MSDFDLGWQAAQQALRTEGTRLQQEDGNLTMWAALVASADMLDALRPPVEETGPEGLIDVQRRKGVEEWILTCSDCGPIGTYPMVFIEKGERHAPEVAWDAHVAEKHPDDTDEPTSSWGHHVREDHDFGDLGTITYEKWGPGEPPARDPDWYIEQQAADVAFHRMGELP